MLLSNNSNLTGMRFGWFYFIYQRVQSNLLLQCDITEADIKQSMLTLLKSNGEFSWYPLCNWYFSVDIKCELIQKQLYHVYINIYVNVRKSLILYSVYLLCIMLYCITSLVEHVTSCSWCVWMISVEWWISITIL